MAHLYQFRVQGHLDAGWAAWFDDLSITLDADGTTLLTGQIDDEAALHGVLVKIRDLGLPLLSVQRLDQQGAEGVG